MPPRPTHPGIPLDVYLQRRRRRTLVLALILPLLFIGLSWADFHGYLFYPGDEFLKYDHQTFSVNHVIDGDTIVINAPDHGKPTTIIRLLGINAPEIAKPWLNDKPSQPFGDEAAAYAHQLCDGKSVTLILEPRRTRERFGRLLAYVVLPDDESMNEAMIANGLAIADVRWSHRDIDRYAMIQEQAQFQAAGIWHKRTRSSPQTQPDQE